MIKIPVQNIIISLKGFYHLKYPFFYLSHLHLKIFLKFRINHLCKLIYSFSEFKSSTRLMANSTKVTSQSKIICEEVAWYPLELSKIVYY